MRAVFSMNVPVPPEQALCISTCLLRAMPVPAEEDGLHVFSADFADEAHVGMKLVHRGCHGDHFLNYLAADQWRNDARPRSGEEDTVAPRRKTVLAFQQREEMKNLLRLLRVVPLIGLCQHIAAMGKPACTCRWCCPRRSRRSGSRLRTLRANVREQAARLACRPSIESALTRLP